MSAPDLDDVAVGLGLFGETGMQPTQLRHGLPGNLRHEGDMHHRWEGVVRGLSHVAVIVGMHRRLAAASSRQDLVGSAGDHLVGVHVALGAGAGLPDHQRELVGQAAFDHLFRRLADRLADLFRQTAHGKIDPRRRQLLNAQGRDDGRGHGLAADLEVLDGALGLRPPIGLGRHLDLAHGVGFAAGGGRTGRLRGHGCCGPRTLRGMGSRFVACQASAGRGFGTRPCASAILL